MITEVSVHFGCVQLVVIEISYGTKKRKKKHLTHSLQTVTLSSLIVIQACAEPRG